MINVELLKNKLKSLPNINVDFIKIKSHSDGLVYSIKLEFHQNKISNIEIGCYDTFILIKIKFSLYNYDFCIFINSTDNHDFQDLLNKFVDNNRSLNIFLLKCYKIHRNNIKNPIDINYDYKTGEFSYGKCIIIKEIFNFKD